MNLRKVSLAIIGFASGFIATTPGRAEATASTVTYKTASKEEILRVLNRIEEAYPRLSEECEVAREALDLPLMTPSGPVDGMCHIYSAKNKWGISIQVGTCCEDGESCKLSMIAVCWKHNCVGVG